MEKIGNTGMKMAVGVRWMARFLAGLLAGSGFLFFIGHDLPDPFAQPVGVQVEFAAMVVVWIGLVVGWRFEAAAGVMIIFGMIVFRIVEGKILLGLVFEVFDLAGVLYLLSWYLKGSGDDIIPQFDK